MQHPLSSPIGEAASESPTFQGGRRSNTSKDESPIQSQLTPPPALNGLLPPTPPSLNSASKPGKPLGPSKQANTVVLNDNHPGSDVNRPINQMRPPTPEHTPPKTTTFLTPRPSAALRDPSPQADSFKTAREEQWSSDGNASREYLLSQSDSKSSRLHSWLDSESHTSIDNTHARGNGTFWEEMTPQLSENSWDKPYLNVAGGDVVEREWDQNLMRNVTVRRKRPRVAGQAQTQDALRRSVNVSEAVSRIENSIQAQRRESWPQPERRSVEEPHSPSQPEIRSVEEPHSPSQPASIMPSRLKELDPKRVSGNSSSSTVVEAVVVDNSPVPNRRLRHVSKTLSLRDGISNQMTSGQNSADENEVPARKLSHKKNMVPHPQWSNDISALPPMNKAFASLRRRRDSLPPRPFTAPDNEVNVYKNDVNGNTYYAGRIATKAKEEERAVSDPTPMRGVAERGQTNGQKRISRELSAGGSPMSLASDSIGGVTPLSEQDSPTDLVRTVKLRHVSRFSNKSAEEDYSTKRQSMDRSTIGTEPDIAPSLVSPQSTFSRSADRNSFGLLFSPASLTSHTPEALEMGEATAVTLYPHNNNSLVVVQQPPSTVVRQQPFVTAPTPPANLPDTPGLFEVEPATPPNGERTDGTVDSPLCNPREAPIPPVVTVIPPTPARDLERLEAQNSSRPTSREHSASKRASILDRARRYSDTFVAPLGSLRRGMSLRKAPAYPTASAPSQQHSNLHPFWRPRNFWDDLSDTSSFDDDYPDDPSSPFDAETDRLPPGGDTRDVLPLAPPPPPLPAPPSSWKRMNSVKGFLIGNTLGLERGPTNKRRHVVAIPEGKRIKRSTASSSAPAPLPQRTRSLVRESARRSGARAKRPSSLQRILDRSSGRWRRRADEQRSWVVGGRA